MSQVQKVERKKKTTEKTTAAQAAVKRILPLPHLKMVSWWRVVVPRAVAGSALMPSSANSGSSVSTRGSSSSCSGFRLRPPRSGSTPPFSWSSPPITVAWPRTPATRTRRGSETWPTRNAPYLSSGMRAPVKSMQGRLLLAQRFSSTIPSSRTRW